jgi:hypothetical protein
MAALALPAPALTGGRKTTLSIAFKVENPLTCILPNPYAEDTYALSYQNRYWCIAHQLAGLTLTDTTSCVVR